jgi:hypothetical protein
MRYGLIALALIGGVYAGFFNSRGPWAEYQKNQRRAAAQRAEMLKLESKKAELVQQTARIETPLGMEMEARKAGFRKRGEVRINGF